MYTPSLYSRDIFEIIIQRKLWVEGNFGTELLLLLLYERETFDFYFSYLKQT